MIDAAKNEQKRKNFVTLDCLPLHTNIYRREFILHWESETTLLPRFIFLGVSLDTGLDWTELNIT
jgi:hypothetical protein